MRLVKPKLKPDKRLILLVLLGTLCLVGGAVQFTKCRMSAPDTEQRIVAVLASWGLTLDGIVSSADPVEIERRVADLYSPIGEKRVQAANWLASRGVRASAANIAVAMSDPGTPRPCQLAKSLGELGDDRWTDKLVAATQQKSNADLRVCATIALGELQSPQAVDALIESYRNGSLFALDALSRIADPSTREFFQQVVSTAPNRHEREIANVAIERIEVLQHADPAEALIERLKQQTAQRRIDEWTIRRLATLQDVRAVTALREAFEQTDKTNERVWLAAALFVHGDAGRVVLSELSQSTSPTVMSKGGPAIAQAALNLKPEPT